MCFSPITFEKVYPMYHNFRTSVKGEEKGEEKQIRQKYNKIDFLLIAAAHFIFL